MTTDLQDLIASARKLSTPEQMELIKAISRFLSGNYRAMQPETEFWRLHSLEEIIQAQQAQPVSDIASLQVNFWPEEETADDFIKYIYDQRKEDGLRD